MYSDEIRELEEKNKPIEVEIHPLSRWKRFLLALGDASIHFILSFLLLSVAIIPLFSLITKADTRGEEMRIVESQRDSVIYDNELLFARYNSRIDYNDNLSYTFDKYLSYFVLDDVDEGEYSHDIKNEVIYTYFGNIKNDKTTYIELYKKQNVKYNYFSASEDSISLKDDYKEPLKYYYVEGEKLGKNGQKIYNDISNMFTIFYKQVMMDIFENDLTYNSLSYNELHHRLLSLQNQDRTYLSLAIFTSYLIAYILLYIVVPLIKFRGKTLTMYIMKVERIGVNNLSRLKTLDSLLTSIYYLIFNLGFILFVPITYFSYGLMYIISLPLLAYFFVIGLIANIVSLFFIIFNSMNRSLGDILSRSVVVTEEDLDQIDMMKGYTSGK